MRTPPHLDVVIVNWNSGPHLAACLRSLAAARHDVHLDRVVVVDNGSRDDSLSADACGLPIEIVRSGGNRGFAAACNLGANRGTADYLLLLNPDARVLPGGLSAPLAWLAAPGHERVGLLGVQLRDASGRVLRSCARVPSPAMFLVNGLGLDRLFPEACPSHFMAEWDHGATRPVDHVPAAVLFMRRSVWTELGGFDERFFVYLEDLDFSLRARQAGWSVWYLTSLVAEHDAGGLSRQVPARRLAYAAHSRIQYGFKHFGRGSALILAVMAITLEPCLRSLWALARGSLREVRDTIVAAGLLWCRLWREPQRQREARRQRAARRSYA